MQGQAEGQESAPGIKAAARPAGDLDRAFVRRYDACPPWDALDERDAYERYVHAAAELTPEQFEECARTALGRVSEAEREHFAAHLVEQARHQDHGYTEFVGKGLARVFAPVDKLAGVATELFRRDRLILENLFTGAIHGRGDDVRSALRLEVALAVFGGIAAEAIRLRLH